MATTSVSLPRKSHGHRSLVGYSPWGCKELAMIERRVCMHTSTLRTLKRPKKVTRVHDVFLGDMIEYHFQAKIVGRTIMSLAKTTEYNIY